MPLIEDLLAAMTIEEKIGQLVMVSLGAGTIVTGPGSDREPSLDEVRQGRIGSILNLVGRDRAHAMQRIAVSESRLGIPLLFGLDVVHGYFTTAPAPLGEAAAFRPDLWQATARMAAEEATADGLALTFAPMLDLARDPRWGRIVEGPGEDPYVGRIMAAAKVRGFQGTDLGQPDTLATTAKHFVAYGAVTAGREYASVDLSERALHEAYLPAFRAAVEAGCAAIMPAFVDLAGSPVSADHRLLTDLVRRGWGFDGVFISDYSAVGQLVNHGVATDRVEAAALALNAGMDFDMMSDSYSKGLKPALDRGLVTIDAIDAAVARVLRLKQRLGLFDDAYARGSVAPRPRHERRVLVRDVAAASLVLLTNPKQTLPLAPTGGPIALIGPFAESAHDMIGPWAGLGDQEEIVTLHAGLRAAFPDREIHTATGVAAEGDDMSGIAAAVALAQRSDIVLLAVGEPAVLSGEAASRAHPGLSGRQGELVRAVLATGCPVVLLLSCGRPLIETELIQAAAATLVLWYPGSEAGHAVADILSGARSPSGRLPVSWPVDVGQIPVWYNQRPTGRPFEAGEYFSTRYRDIPNEPLFPFGHGLSYTTFDLGAPGVDAPLFRAGDTVTVRIDVTNTGAIAADTTVFLFLHDLVASVTRPVIELRRFQTVHLAAGETKTLRFDLETADFAALGPDLVARAEPGDFDLAVGFSADRGALKTVRVTLEAPPAA